MESMQERLHQITAHQFMALDTGSDYFESWLDSYHQTVVEREGQWLVPCTHTLNSPASPDDLQRAERLLNRPLPEALAHFLLVSNGADLYVSVLPDRENMEWARYHLFGTDELVKTNEQLSEYYKEDWPRQPNDPDALQYVAFCDGINGGYLCILLETQQRGLVFHLHREHYAQPYCPEAIMNAVVAESFEAWLAIIAEFKGVGGFGHEE